MLKGVVKMQTFNILRIIFQNQIYILKKINTIKKDSSLIEAKLSYIEGILKGKKIID